MKFVSYFQDVICGLWSAGLIPFLFSLKGEILGVVSAIRGSLGELPIVEDEMRKAAGEAGEDDGSGDKAGQPQQQQKVTADGTYASQSAFSTTT